MMMMMMKMKEKKKKKKKKTRRRRRRRRRRMKRKKKQSAKQKHGKGFRMEPENTGCPLHLPRFSLFLFLPCRLFFSSPAPRSSVSCSLLPALSRLVVLCTVALKAHTLPSATRSPAHSHRWLASDHS